MASDFRIYTISDSRYSGISCSCCNGQRAKQKGRKMSDIHPKPTEFSDDEVSADHILRFFHYSHLPAALQARSKPFCDLARHIIDTTPRNAERTVALRKLLEAKDAGVRAGL
jgi:hypothetical protein